MLWALPGGLTSGDSPSLYWSSSSDALALPFCAPFWHRSLGCDPRIWELAAVSGGPSAVRPLSKLSRVLHDGFAHVRGDSTDPLALGSGIERADLRVSIISGISRREAHGAAGIHPRHSL